PADDLDLRATDPERLTGGGADPGRRHDLGVQVRVERPQGDERAAGLQGELGGELTVDQLGGLLLQPVVDLVVHRPGHDEVRRDGHEGHRDAHRARRQQGDPLAQRERSRPDLRPGYGHYGVSRSTYPTPRTVWMSRTSPSPSVLRRS